MRITRITVEGARRWALEVDAQGQQHYVELRTILRHPLTSIARVFAWLMASRDEGSSV